MEKIDQIAADSNEKVGVDEERKDYDIDQQEYVPNDNRKGMKYRKYSASFKLAVVDFAKRNSLTITMQKFRVSESNIILWKKEEKKLRELVEKGKGETFRLPGAGRKPIDFDMQVKWLIIFANFVSFTFGKVFCKFSSEFLLSFAWAGLELSFFHFIF